MPEWNEPASAGDASADATLAEATNNIRLVKPAAPRDEAAAKEAADRGWTRPTLTAEAPLEESLAALNTFNNEFAKVYPTHAAAAAKFE